MVDKSQVRRVGESVCVWGIYLDLEDVLWHAVDLVVALLAHIGHGLDDATRVLARWLLALVVACHDGRPCAKVRAMSDSVRSDSIGGRLKAWSPRGGMDLV